MASGMTTLLAVNEIVETLTPFPTDTAPTDSTKPDIYSKALLFLEREDKRVQSQGWPENSENSEAYTATAGAIEVLDTVLRVRSASNSAHRTLVIRDNSGTQQLYDSDNGTFVFGNTETVLLDTVEKLSFANLPPLLQDVIVAKAKWEFQRKFGKDPQVDQALYQEYVQAEIVLDRNRPDRQQPFNVQPMIPGASQQKQAKE